MDPDEYRKQYRAEIGAVPEPARDLDGALATVRDESAPLDDRLEAARTVNLQAYGSAEAIDALLAILADEDAPPELRRMAIAGVEVLKMSSKELMERQADLTATLKNTMESRDDELRNRSIRLLAADRDADVQRRLIDGLRNESVAITSARRSVELLGYDPKAGHYDVLREVADTHDDPEVRREAIRQLSSDAESREMLERVVRNKAELAAVRDTSAAALQAVAPEEFERVAHEIVTDDSDYDDIKASVLSKLAYQKPRSDAPEEFVRTVAKARDELADDAPLKQAASSYSTRRDS